MPIRPSRRRQPRTLCWLIAAGLVACTTGSPTPGAASPPTLPTAIPTSLFGVPPASTLNPTTETDLAPTIAPATIPPALALPDPSGVAVACAANALRLPITDPAGGSFGAVSRLLASGSWLYLLADGGLYRADRQGIEAGQLPHLEPLLLPGDDGGGRPVQELTDLDANPASGQIIALDKAGHVFGIDPTDGRASVLYRASSETDEKPGQLSHGFVALTVDEGGRIILLDSSRGVLVALTGAGTLLAVNRGSGLTASVDVAAVGDRFYTLQRNGTLRAINGPEGSSLWRDADGRHLGLALKVSDHLGAPLVVSVDGLRREVLGMLPGGGIVTRHVFAFPDMGLLRDAVFADGRLIGVADDSLLIYPGPASSATPQPCPPLAQDIYLRPRLYGVDVLRMLDGFRLPIDGAELPPYARSYPGAARLYRLGIHHGVDFFGFRRGWPVVAVAGGQVVTATLVYDDVSADDFERMVAESERLGQTPSEYLERLEGRTVVIDHGNGVRSVYAHLDEIAPGIVPGAWVSAGQPVGTVGVSGTQAESQPGTVGAHLHFEIVIGDRYLGQGITIRETMWWFGEIFKAAEGVEITPTP